MGVRYCLAQWPALIVVSKTYCPLAVLAGADGNSSPWASGECQESTREARLQLCRNKQTELKRPPWRVVSTETGLLILSPAAQIHHHHLPHGLVVSKGIVLTDLVLGSFLSELERSLILFYVARLQPRLILIAKHSWPMMFSMPPTPTCSRINSFR